MLRFFIVDLIISILFVLTTLQFDGGKGEKLILHGFPYPAYMSCLLTQF